MTWLLLLALAAYGLTGALQELVASRHTHLPAVTPGEAPAFEAIPGWVDFRRVGAAATRVAHDHADGQLHRHRHDRVERHHHPLTDSGVVTLDDDGVSGDAASTLSNAGGHAGAAPGTLTWFADRPNGGAWTADTAQHFRSAEPRLAERPPRG